LSVNFALFAMP